MDALQNNDGKTHLIKRTSTEAKLMGFASVFMCARQEQQLSGVRPQRARQQEALAEGKGVHREMESEGSRMSAENAGGQTPEPTNRNHIEGRTGTDECARQHEVQCCPNPVR